MHECFTEYLFYDLVNTNMATVMNFEVISYLRTEVTNHKIESGWNIVANIYREIKECLILRVILGRTNLNTMR